jgi:hypothetical protein
MSTFNGSLKPVRPKVSAASSQNQPKSSANKTVQDQGPWPEPNWIDPSILGTINSIHAHMRRGVPIS